MKSVFQDILSDGSADSVADDNGAILDKIFATCATIIDTDLEGIQLEEKIVLSIGIRLKAEKLLIDKINDQSYVDSIQKHQTSKLIRKYSRNGNADENIIKIMNKVSLMTPENIHLNSFMFEPILDMSMHHLKTLYQEIEAVH